LRCFERTPAHSCGKHECGFSKSKNFSRNFFDRQIHPKTLLSDAAKTPPLLRLLFAKKLPLLKNHTFSKNVGVRRKKARQGKRPTRKLILQVASAMRWRV